MEGSQGKKVNQSETRDGMRRDEVFTKIVRAGTRTYYFDVRTIRDNSRYITITESKRKIDSSGNPFYMKHKIFLYHEDFEKFSEGLKEAILNAENEETAQVSPIDQKRVPVEETVKQEESEFTNLDFDDLEDK
jgi:adenine-specific DNA methylase